MHVIWECETKIYLYFSFKGVTNDCPMICEVTCEDDELLCTSGTDPVTGCKENDFCHP